MAEAVSEANIDPAEAMGAAMVEARARAEAEVAAEEEAAAEALAESLKALQSATAKPTLLPMPTRLIVQAGTGLFDELRAAGLGDGVSVTPNAVEVDPSVDAATLARIKAAVAAHDPLKSSADLPPDGPTLSDWRVGLLLWGRRDELLGKVEAEKAKGTPIGAIADERVNYANNVLRAQLLQLRAVFGFTEAEIDESLWRADRVAKGDLSGVWPLSG